MKTYKYLVYLLLSFSFGNLEAQEINLNKFCTNYASTYVFLSNKALKGRCDLAKKYRSSSLNSLQEKKACLSMEKDKSAIHSRRRALSRKLSSLSNMIKFCDSEEYAQRSIYFDTLGIIERDEFTEQLIAAVKKDDVNKVKQLILQGVDPFYELGMNFGTPLYHAIKAQAKHSVRFLIDIGASPNRVCNGCGNPLNNLLKNKVIDYSLLEYLLKNGSNPNYYGEGANLPPISIAVERNDFKATQMLLKHGTTWFQSLSSKPVLISAIKHNNLPIIKLLLKHGVDPDGDEPCSMSPMFYAKGNVKISQLLVEYGAKCDAS